MQIIPKIDSRHWSFQEHCGDAILPKEYSAEKIKTNAIQPPGDVRCVLFTICDILKDKDGVEYDIDDLERRVGMYKDGTDPIRAIKEVIKNGILPKGGTERVFPISSFFTGHTGPYDIFDNTRRSIMLAQYPIMAYGPWFTNWQGGFEEKGKNFSGYHCADTDGWIIGNIGSLSVTGEYISCEAWTGEKHYFSREVFNDWAKKWGFNTVVLSTKEIDARREKTIMEAIIDACKNVIVKMRQLHILRSIGRIPSLYDIAYANLGKHLTLDDSVPKEVGCAQCMSWLLKRYGCKIPYGGISGTAELKEWLDRNALKIDNPEVGCIRLYATDSGNGKVRGHVFVEGKYQLMSNNSKTGLLDTQWTSGEAKLYYEIYGGLKPHYYKV